MRFSVDTHLFRELGEYLVGRNSTALAELVKNAYDADATRVTVYGERLSDSARGYIEIQDDGVGMTVEEFEQGFLRIASRIKESGSRYSMQYNRRYTGAKGLGRLAAHKLARHLSINSVPSVEKAGTARLRIQAEFDWDLIEECGSIDKISSNALSVETSTAPKSAHAGTTIRLSRLRQTWSEARRARFVSEVRAYQPAAILVQALDKELAPFSPLFSQPVTRDRAGDDPGFSILLSGDFEQGDEQWKKVFSATRWVLEIDATEGGEGIAYRFTPTRRKRKGDPSAEQHSFVTPYPTPKSGPFYQARIFVCEGRSPLKRSEDLSGLYSGIRLFMEGFRVLPYGERRDDWLEISADYSDRSDRIRALGETAFPDLLSATEDLQTSREGLSVLPSRSYLGGVFLTQKGASSLRVVVNREGFEPNPQFDTLVESIRTGLGLLTRVRAYYSEPTRERRRETRASKRPSPVEETPPALSERTRRAVEQTQADASKAEQLASVGDTSAAGAVLIDSAKRIQTLALTAADTLRDQSGMVRVVASVGLQMGEFVHEVRSALGEAKLLVTELDEFRRSEDLASKHRKKAARIARMAESLNRTIEWLARSLDEVSTIDKRRRRQRQDLRIRFDEAIAFVRMAAEKRSVHIENRIKEKTMTCPMFRSELFAILLNVLSNAVKYAGEDGRVVASAERADDGQLQLRVENTGRKVNLAEAERLFRAFESSSSAADPALGQGMGLGLPITRDLLEEYGGSIAFVTHSEDYVTAIEVTLPK